MSDQRTVFIERFPAKGELPEKEGVYMCQLAHSPISRYYKEGEWYNEIGGIVDAPEYWLEEVPLSSLLPEIVMPTYDIMSDILDGVDHYGTTDTTKRIFKEIKSLNPSLFPSTTKTDKDE